MRLGSQSPFLRDPDIVNGLIGMGGVELELRGALSGRRAEEVVGAEAEGP